MNFVVHILHSMTFFIIILIFGDFFFYFQDDLNAMIFAAGFDSSRNIFLGEKATKWENGENEVDGLTTNGVLIMHPKGEFCPPEDCPNPMPGIWREVSVSI